MFFGKKETVIDLVQLVACLPIMSVPWVGWPEPRKLGRAQYACIPSTQEMKAGRSEVPWIYNEFEPSL